MRMRPFFRAQVLIFQVSRAYSSVQMTIRHELSPSLYCWLDVMRNRWFSKIQSREDALHGRGAGREVPLRDSGRAGIGPSGGCVGYAPAAGILLHRGK
jgi:hypothetical protein